MRLSWIIPVGPVSSQGSLEVKEQERRVRGLKQHKLFYSSVVHDTKMGLTELKKKNQGIRRTTFLSGRFSRGKSISLPFPASRGPPHSLALGLFSSLKPTTVGGVLRS